MTPPAIALRSVIHDVGGRGHRLRLLDDVTLEVAAGESLSVVGRSGSGKTTLLSILGLMQRPTAGHVEVDGASTQRLSDNALSRLRNESLGYVFQGYSLLPHLNAIDNVLLPATYGSRFGGHARRAAAELLDRVGLADAHRKRPRQLSGGEQQRVAIARALIREPKVILADEPTGALDVGTGDAVMSSLLDVVAERGAALVLVTHDPELAARTSRRVVIADGRLSIDRTSDRRTPVKPSTADLGAAP